MEMNNVLSLIDPMQYAGDNDRYVFNGIGVPRVTEILSAMLHEDYLMGWANAMGLYKHQKYEDILSLSADIGTYTHSAIERYLSEGKELDLDEYPYRMRQQVSHAFNSFLEWWGIIKKIDHEILMQETKLVCKYFGGTIDMLIKINDKIYAVDFKTSNHSSYKHFLQLAAYRYMLKEAHGIETDGCIVLMLDKKTCRFTELILDFSNTDHLLFMDNCEETFLSLVYAYYNRGRIENMYKDIFGRK